LRYLFSIEIIVESTSKETKLELIEKGWIEAKDEGVILLFVK